MPLWSRTSHAYLCAIASLAQIYLEDFSSFNHFARITTKAVPTDHDRRYYIIDSVQGWYEHQPSGGVLSSTAYSLSYRIPHIGAVLT